MRILVAGDCHGRFDDLNAVIVSAIRKYKVEACIQVGDFGFYPNVFSTFSYLKFPIPVMAIDGNHENHEWLKWCIECGEAESWKNTRNLEYVPRGTIRTIDNTAFGFLGGAMNVDRKQEGSTAKRTTNYPLNSEIREAADLFNSYNKPLDFLITHSCPHSVGVGIVGKPAFIQTAYEYITKPLGMTTGGLSDCGEETLKNLWDKMHYKPKHWIFGHMHMVKQKGVGETLFSCVGCVDSQGGHNFAYPFIIDTVSNTFEAFMNDTLLNTKGTNAEVRKALRKSDYPV